MIFLRKIKKNNVGKMICLAKVIDCDDYENRYIRLTSILENIHMSITLDASISRYGYIDFA